MDTSAFYLQLLLELLSSPAGIISVAAVVLLAVISIFSERLRWVLLGVALWVSTLPIVGEEGKLSDFSLAFPIEQIRAYARPMTLAFLGCLILPLFTMKRERRSKLFSGFIVAFVIYQVGLAARMTMGGGVARGAMTLISITIVFVAICVTQSAAMRDYSGVRKALWAIAISVFGLVLGTLYQLAIDSSQIMAHERLIGVSGNPQFMAVAIAITLPTMLFLSSDPATSKKRRLAIFMLLPFALMMLIWTGSRTGALAATVAVLVMFWRRLGRLALLGGLLLTGVLIVASFYEGSLDVSERLISTTDTRSANWIWQWSNFMANPVFGSSEAGVATVENSYLSMLGQLGLVGTIPFLVAAILLTSNVVQLQRLRGVLATADAPLVDCLTASWCSIAVAAMFEGFLTGTLVYPVLLIYVLASINSFVIDSCRFVAAEGTGQYAATSAVLVERTY